MDAVDGPPSSFGNITKNTQKKTTGEISHEDLPSSSDMGSPLDEERNRDYEKRVEQAEEDVLPTIHFMGKPLDEEFDLEEELLDGNDMPQHRKITNSGYDREDGIISTICEMGKPLIEEKSLKRRVPAGTAFKIHDGNDENEFDDTDRPQASRKNDQKNNDKQGESNDDTDVVDGNVHRGMTRNGNHYLNQRRSSEEDKYKIITTHTSYHPQKHNQDEVDFKPPDNCYDMTCFPRGVFILINVKKFVSLNERNGTEIDAENLTELFLDFGFIVERFDNPSTKEINTIMDSAANMDYSNKSCCACAILSHGDMGIIYSKDGEVKIDQMLKNFESEQLKSIPKLFFIQACRGGIYMDQIKKFKESNLTDPEKPGVPDYLLSLPEEPDFLCAFANPPGYYSWRRDSSGSWFIQALVEVFRNNALKVDVLTMLVRVNEIVAFRVSNVPGDKDAHQKKEIPSFVCQLSKDLFLYPPKGFN